ncbi:MAG: beta-glucosidase BglX [Chthoniobacteraceae bacterium]
MRVTPHGFGVRLSVSVVCLAVLCAGWFAPAVWGEDEGPAFVDSPSIEKKVAALLKQMTLEEKVGQMTQFSRGNATGPDSVKADQNELAARGCVGSMLNVTGAKEVNELQRQAVEKSRLKIPILFGLDVIHGYHTTYPVPLGLSASWDPGLVERCARMAAVEATAEGVRWTFSPMVDIARDARWGRITEGSGEDPWLGSVMAAAWVRGYQGKRLSDPASMVACAKHYVAYGGVEGGREYNLVDVSERVLRDVYLPPFKAACDAGAGTFMSAFNTLQGVPASANRHTLTDILRTEWGFRGFVVSDWNSIGELREQGVALDGDEAARKAVTAGVDMDMQSNLYITRLAGLVKSGKLKMEVIDEAVRRILRIKFALGLFDHPYTAETPAVSAMPGQDHLETARHAAEESFVLLKNDAVNSKPVLPLADGQTVALIGPLADAKRHMLGAWPAKGVADDVVTLREALSQRLKEKLIYAKGVPIWDKDGSGFDEAIAAAKKCDVVVMALGEGAGMSGEASSRTTLDLPGKQLELLQAVVATGKPVALVLFNGRPLSIPWEAGHVPAILEAWFPGVQAGPALVRTLYGEVNPAGRLTVSFPRSVGQMPLYYNTFNTGRPAEGVEPGSGFITGYKDERNTALFPFGWGLSYTKFDYSPTVISTAKMGAAELNGDGAIHVEATVTNSGALAGAEVAQLYIRERGTSVVRPVRELKGFEKMTLAPGESRKVQFALTKKDLSFWNIDMKQTVEPCELTVWVGPNSEGGQAATILIGP